METIDKDNSLLYSAKGMGNGLINDVYDVIYVDINKFDKSFTNVMADEIEKLNEMMVNDGRKYI